MVEPNSARPGYLEGHRWNPLTTTPLGGRILSAAQLPWFSLQPPRGFGVLTTLGRKTGKRRRKCVRAIREGTRVYVVALGGPQAAWVLNIRANPRVSVRLHEGYFDGVARDLQDVAERAEARTHYVSTVNRFDRMEFRMHRRGRPRSDRIRALHAQWFDTGTPIVVELKLDIDSDAKFQ